MKTSNIIITSLVGSITLIIMATFMQLRLTGAKKPQYAEQIYATLDLAPFRFLVLHESLNVAITSSDSTNLVIRNAKGQEKPIVDYHQTGDTLFIDRVKFGMNDRTLTVTIHTRTGDLQWIKATATMFSLQNYPASSLRIELDSSRLFLSSKDSLHLRNLQITGVNQSSIDARNISVDTLNVYLDHSEGSFHNAIQTLSGSMSNHAELFAEDVREVSFKKDKSSRWVH